VTLFFVAALVILAICVLILFVVLRSTQRNVKALTSRANEIEARLEDFGPLLADTRSALRKAESRNVKADDLVSAATALTDRADAATKLAYTVATTPLVRVAAFGRGLRRGAAALKDRPAPPPALPAGRRRDQPSLPSADRNRPEKRFRRGR
jgi:hypothetical protein